MFRIASYYPDQKTVGRNDGGPLYHTRILRKIFGDDSVMHLLPMGDLSCYGKFDFHYWVDFGDDAVGMDSFVCPKPNAYIVSDTHLGYDYRLKKAREFDHVFCNQLRAVLEFRKEGIKNPIWLPHAFDPLAYSPGAFNLTKNDWDRDTAVLKKYDVCFIGNLNDENRALHLDRIFKSVNTFYWGTQRFHEAAEKFNQSKIVFNVSARDDVNMRVFEALGSRSFLLTNEIPTLSSLFKKGVHLETYDSMDEMVDKARYYTEHDEERERIAEAGYIEALSHHTYAHRVMKVLDECGIEYDKEKADKLLPKVLSKELV